MKIILLKDISKIGKRYDIKEVSDGHAINFLIPRGLAISATPDSIKRVEIEKDKIDGDKKIQGELLIKSIAGLDGKSIIIKGKANDKGHLFAGIHKEEIIAEIERQTRLKIDSSFIELEHPIKEIGETTIKINREGKSADLKIVVETLD